jgi:hypothetical protein
MPQRKISTWAKLTNLACKRYLERRSPVFSFENEAGDGQEAATKMDENDFNEEVDMPAMSMRSGACEIDGGDVAGRDLKIAKQLTTKSISIEREVPLLGTDISRWHAKRWWQQDRAG